jgi:hypothetical protein
MIITTIHYALETSSTYQEWCGHLNPPKSLFELQRTNS